MSSLTGWHRGERIAREKTGFDAVPAMRMLWTNISGEMPEQHSTFYTTRLPFIPVCILVKDGEDGYNALIVQAVLSNGDPFLRVSGVDAGGKEDEDEKNLDKPLIAGIGIELSTRRRNKFAGHITKMVLKKGLLDCPKYITLRELTPWVAVSADYDSRMPADTSPTKIFTMSFVGIYAPVCFTEILGAVLTAVNSPESTQALNEQGFGGLLAQVLSPWHGGGRFLLLILGLSVLTNNIFHTYSFDLSMQSLFLSGSLAGLPPFL